MISKSGLFYTGSFNGLITLPLHHNIPWPQLYYIIKGHSLGRWGELKKSWHSENLFENSIGCCYYCAFQTMLREAHAEDTETSLSNQIAFFGANCLHFIFKEVGGQAKILKISKIYFIVIKCHMSVSWEYLFFPVLREHGDISRGCPGHCSQPPPERWWDWLVMTFPPF